MTAVTGDGESMWIVVCEPNDNGPGEYVGPFACKDDAEAECVRLCGEQSGSPSPWQFVVAPLERS